MELLTWINLVLNGDSWLIPNRRPASLLYRGKNTIYSRKERIICEKESNKLDSAPHVFNDKLAPSQARFDCDPSLPDLRLTCIRADAVFVRVVQKYFVPSLRSILRNESLGSLKCYLPLGGAPNQDRKIDVSGAIFEVIPMFWHSWIIVTLYFIAFCNNNIVLTTLYFKS